MATFPTVKVQAQFTPGTWTDITSYVRSGTITRPGSRLAGPVWQYGAGTCSLVLKNPDGRFDADNLAGPYVGVNVPKTLTFQSGAGNWTAPAGITATMTAACTAPGGGGHWVAHGAGASGGSGEYAGEPALAVTAGQVFSWSVGAPGTSGVAGGNVVFGPVTAHGGGGASGITAGVAGTGSTNTVHHDGAAGGAGVVTVNYGGAGGASSAGPSSAGNPGTAAGVSPGAGAAAVTGGGPGGAGGPGTGSSHQGLAPTSGPGGGGGGAGEDGTVGGAGAPGLITITYTVTVTASQVLPMVPIQVQATWNAVTYTLFTGYADAWTDPGDNYAGNYDEVTVTATDAFKIFAGITFATLGSPVGAGEDSGARVNRILNSAGWSSPARAIDTGDTNVQATSYGGTVMNLLQVTADTELGELYMAGSGNLTFRHRHAIFTDARSSTPQAVFGDSPGTSHSAGTELKYEKVSRASDDTTLVNDAQITAVGGVLQEVTATDSVALFLYARTFTRTDLIMQSDPEALSYAQWLVYVGQDTGNRFDVLSVIPARDATNLFPQVLGRELGDRIQVWRRPPNVAAISKDCFIRGIQHDFTPLWWHTQWTLQSAAKYGSFLTLDNATLGKLDSNVLGF